MSQLTLGQICADRIFESKARGVAHTRATVADLINEEAQKLEAAANFPADKIPPTSEAVNAYSAKIGANVDGNAFCDHYEAKGWKIGKTPMKNWQAAVRTWRKNQASTSHSAEPFKFS
jgi:hypothetical protein